MQRAAAKHPDISVVIPVHDEEGNIPELLSRVTHVLENLPQRPSSEIILVNDGSTDGTVEAVHRCMATIPNIALVSLSRNFGHQLAATAGLDVAQGDAVILMDGDLQDPPELIEAFLEKWRLGYDVVYAIRRSRKGESRFKLFTARAFYRLTRRLTKVSIPVDTGDFRLMSRRVIEALKRTRERNRFLRGLVSWVGFNQIGIEYDRDSRHAGSTKYPVSKMFRFAMDGITAFSEVPLRFASYFGFIVSAFAFVYAIIVLIMKFEHRNFPGYTSIMIAILFLGGVQLVGIGILGEYLGRVHDEIKGRPLYLISDIKRN